MSFKLLDKATAIGASPPVKMFADIGVKDHTVEVEIRSLGTVAISAVEIKLQGSHTAQIDSVTGVVTNPALAIGSTATNVANGAFIFMIGGTNYTQAALATGSTFTAAHRVTAGKYGVVLVYVNAAGAISTQVPLSTQAYNTAALAHAASDAMLTGAGVNPNIVNIGRILIAAGGADWVANTNNLTNGSGLTTATFTSVTSTFQDILTYDFTAADLTAGRTLIAYKGIMMRYIRCLLSVFTGTGTVSVRYTPIDDP